MTVQDPIESFVKELAGFDSSLSVLDHVWAVRFPDANGKWQHVHVNRYRKTTYISHINSDLRIPVLVLEPKTTPTLEGRRGISAYRRVSDDEELERWRQVLEEADQGERNALGRGAKAEQRHGCDHARAD